MVIFYQNNVLVVLRYCGNVDDNQLIDKQLIRCMVKQNV